MPWRVESYRDARGRVPVNNALESLAATDQARLLRVIELLVEYGPSLKMPHARHLHGKLSELRMDGRPNSYRVIYAAVPGGAFLLLHLFAKKTQATPPREIDAARRRLADYERRKNDEQGKNR
jgi:phage-related protein